MPYPFITRGYQGIRPFPPSLRLMESRAYTPYPRLCLSTDFGDSTQWGRVIEFARSHNVSSLEVVMNEWNTRYPGGRYLVAEHLKDWLQLLSNA
jgi:hypothetical protein